jgi:hypothetical protein
VTSARTARRHQVTSLLDLDRGDLTGDLNTLLTSFLLKVNRATITPVEEQRKDHWDLAVFGAAGQIDFTVLTQPWLREIAKHWASEDLVRRRGDRSGMVVRTHIGSLAELSTTLRLTRTDHGVDPTMLGRADILAFLARLGHLEQTEALSANRRLQIIRHVCTVLRDTRDLGLTRPGQRRRAARGVRCPRRRHPGPAAHRRPRPVVAERGHERAKHRAAAAGGRQQPRRPRRRRTADGHRPTPRRGVPTADGLPREGCRRQVRNDLHRLQGEPTPAPATDTRQHRETDRDQQTTVRATFPHTNPADLVLLPAVSTNPDGTRPLRARVLTNIHRGWVDRLPEFEQSDGGIFPAIAVVPYAYRHTYAQRYADAGTPIDVLRELMGHRSVHSTETYYKITETRTRAAVNRVAEHQFGGAGNRIWRQVTALLDSERARMRVGQIAVPYGSAPNRPTSKPPAPRARSGSAASAAGTSAPTYPTSPS